MGIALPPVSESEFEERLRVCSPVPLSSDQVALLHLHYAELRRWNRRVAMVGSVSREEVVERHYGESLAVLPFLSPPRGELVDVGSGAGFPGLILALACPGLEVTLVEATGRKWSFLKSVCRQAGLSTVCLNARVDRQPIEGLPREISWITARAVRFQGLGLAVLLPRLTAKGSLLFWGGVDDPALPDGLRISRQAPLSGSKSRRIIEIKRQG